MGKVSPFVFIPPAIFAAVAGLFLGGMFWGADDDLPSAFIGQAAPSVPPTSLTGLDQLTDADLRSGEITLVNYWASWCPPCRVEHPELMDLAERGIRVAGVNFRDIEDNALEYLSEEGNPFFKSAFDPTGRTSIDWGVTAPPETFIIDKDGTVLFRFAGPLVGSDYQNRFVPALNAALGG